MQIRQTSISSTIFMIFIICMHPNAASSLFLKVYKCLDKGKEGTKPQADVQIDSTNALASTISQENEYLLFNRINTLFGGFFNTVGQIVLGTRPMNEEVTFWCSNSNNPDYIQVYVKDPMLDQKLDVSKPIAFLTHGWTDNVNRTWVKTTVADYIKFVGGNVCAVDWSRMALTEYNLAASHTQKVGAYLGTFIKSILENGFTIDQVTLIGHSMGAHISGIAGAALKGRVPLLIGLDPAGPAFTKPFLGPLHKRLDPSDAIYVQNIHTDKNIIGTTYNLGHQDFYPNGGANPQPGCDFPLVNNDTTKSYLQFICSHFKAVEYFRSSLDPEHKFQGTSCANFYQYKKGNCKSNNADNFGVYSSKTGSGSMYLNITKTVYPYVDL